MIVLSKEKIIRLHEKLINEYGGSHGIRDDKLLDAALAAPFQSFGGTDLFPSLIDKAARLCYGLVKNHAFIDGNKRIGIHAMLVFLELNGITLTYSQKELIDITLKAAEGSCDDKDIAKWVIDHYQDCGRE